MDEGGVRWHEGAWPPIVWVRWHYHEPNRTTPVSIWHALYEGWADDPHGRGLLCRNTIPDPDEVEVEQAGDRFTYPRGHLCQNCRRTIATPKEIRRRKRTGEIPAHV